jgi:far upstream element-binding protein
MSPPPPPPPPTDDAAASMEIASMFRPASPATLPGTPRSDGDGDGAPAAGAASSPRKRPRGEDAPRVSAFGVDGDVLPGGGAASGGEEEGEVGEDAEMRRAVREAQREAQEELELEAAEGRGVGLTDRPYGVDGDGGPGDRGGGHHRAPDVIMGGSLGGGAGDDGEEVSEVLEVDRASVGFVIGRNGATIKQIIAESGAAVDTNKAAGDDREKGSFTLRGTRRQVACCRVLIGQKLEVLRGGDGTASRRSRDWEAGGGFAGDPAETAHALLWVPVEKVGLVIGTGGSTVRGLRDKSGAIISVHNNAIEDGRKRFLVSGDRQSVLRASDLVKDFVSETVCGKVVAGPYFGDVGGSGGKRYGECGGSGGGRGDSSGGGGGKRLKYDDGGRSPGSAGGGDAAAEFNTKCVYIPSSCVGVVIGRGGETIRELQKRSGANIKVTGDEEAIGHSERLITISGSSHVIERAHTMLNDLVREAQSGQPSPRAEDSDGRGAARDRAGQLVEDEMTVAADRIGLVIGKEGKTVRDIETRSGAAVTVSRPSSDGRYGDPHRAVVVSGTRPQVELAKSLIRDVLEQFEERPQRLSRECYSGDREGRDRGRDGRPTEAASREMRSPWAERDVYGAPAAAALPPPPQHYAYPPHHAPPHAPSPAVYAAPPPPHAAPPYFPHEPYAAPPPHAAHARGPPPGAPSGHPGHAGHYPPPPHPHTPGAAGAAPPPQQRPPYGYGHPPPYGYPPHHPGHPPYYPPPHAAAPAPTPAHAKGEAAAAAGPPSPVASTSATATGRPGPAVDPAGAPPGHPYYYPPAYHYPPAGGYPGYPPPPPHQAPGGYGGYPPHGYYPPPPQAAAAPAADAKTAAAGGPPTDASQRPSPVTPTTSEAGERGDAAAADAPKPAVPATPASAPTGPPPYHYPPPPYGHPPYGAPPASGYAPPPHAYPGYPPYPPYQGPPLAQHAPHGAPPHHPAGAAPRVPHPTLAGLPAEPGAPGTRS